jgi:hypothetical protein
MNFLSIEYLKTGNQLQKEVYNLLTKNRVMEKLKRLHPILVGTIPINIATNYSDLDIVCTFENKELFKEEIQSQFSAYPDFSIIEKSFQNESTVIVRFKMKAFPVEIFAQRKPSNQQMAFLHMLIEHKILEEEGKDFRKSIIELKENGLKTEPAFTKLLNLQGDSYLSLLKYGKQKGFI